MTTPTTDAMTTPTTDAEALRLAGVDCIPCGVPYWDEARFMKLGGQFRKDIGFYVHPLVHRDDFEDWLPRKWQYRGDPPVPVLLPDMLPSSTWEANLRHALSEAEWDRLRKACYRAAGFTCVACGSRGEPHLEAHEAWRFDESTGVQRLHSLLCLCPTCHKAKHLGFANRMGQLPQVLRRLKWLNDWDDATLQSELRKVERRQEELSKRTWKLDLSFLIAYGVR